MFRKFTEAMRRQLEEGEAPAAPRAVGEATVAAKTVAAAPATSAAPPPPPPPPAAENVLDVGALGTTALGRAAMRTLRRPAFWIGVVVLVLIVYWLARG
jgi:hypothetical protein